MDLETRLEMLLELAPETLEPGLAERLMDEVLGVLRRHLPVKALEARLEKREGHLVFLAAVELAD
ncbi:MAG: hypothetical protein NZ846_02215 [Thermus sp.]|uniref:hypothetical protein n=1 Tax=unclassified Thermus TaxID=2619321 RepID=UPI00059C5713|nr:MULTISPECIES: hypothetical protein [unclassified Thermus]MCS6869053.1 hypothetical protein [Thermus sp.]MCS7217777.1 hypothetical protein [Thermus sp.]MCX7849566.1 hypothetical protein [Thermus sp.]MDW8016595.1 hypothetical protein [Thermus sp.]MDW8356494.1 hypothetical protein [Thermus sp.]